MTIQVRLVIPEQQKHRSPSTHGEHYAYNGKTGIVLCGAGNGGAWVKFDGHNDYVGCPIKWLEKAE